VITHPSEASAIAEAALTCRSDPGIALNQLFICEQVVLILNMQRVSGGRC
jgi:hypothetical protein